VAGDNFERSHAAQGERERELRCEPILRRRENVAQWHISAPKWDDGGGAAKF
jgi:hypothetical protein